MAARDFIISFFADSPQLTAAIGKLTSAPLIWSPNVPVPEGRITGDYHGYVASLGNSIQAIFGQVKKTASDTLGRVAVIGFSEGGQGVDAILGCSDASGIDTVINCDGIHTEYVGQTDIAHPPPIHLISPASLSKYIAFANLAVQTPPSKGGDKLMVLTHSSIKPSYASTTETMTLIWAEALKSAPAQVEDLNCGWYCPAAVQVSDLANIVWPNATLPLGTKVGGGVIDANGYTTIRPSSAATNFMNPAPFSWSGFADGWSIRRVANGLYVFGWAYPTPNHTKDPTGNRDHIFQAQMVLPNVAAEMLVKRWNSSCASPPIATQGFGSSCDTTGGGQPLDPTTAAPLPDPYPGFVLPSLAPADCNVPPGRIIIGRPGDPCWTGEPLPPPVGFANFGASLVGAGLGYFGARWLVNRFL